MACMSAPLTVLCRPLLRAPRDVAAPVLRLGWRSVWGADDGLTDVDPSSTGLTCTVDGVPCGLSTLPTAMPRQELASTDSALWPGAGDQAASCPAHAVVWAEHLPDGREAARAHTALSRLVAATLPVLDSPGVHVPSAQLLVRSDLWTGLTKQSSPPLLLWVRLACRPEHPGTTGLATSGLAGFGLPEVEVAGSSRSAEELRSWVAELLSWLVTEQPDLHDGDTLAIAAGENVLVRFARSVLDRPEPVLRLVEGL